MKTIDESVVDKLFQRVAQHPDKVYLRQPKDGVFTEYTWSQVGDQVKRMAAALQSLGLKKGDRIAIAGKNTAHWIMADLATFTAGCVGLGIYPKMSSEHINFILDHSEAKAIFVGPSDDQDVVAASIPDGVIKIKMPYDGITVPCDYDWDDLIANNEPIAELPSLADDDLAALIYTSGTTGNPKGVMITSGNIKFGLSGMVEIFGDMPNERWLSYLPLAHIFERAVVELASIYQGATVSFLEDLPTFARDLNAVRPTRFIAVPLIWSRLQKGILEKMPQEKLDKLLRIPLVNKLVKKKMLSALGMENVRIAFSGAAPLSPSIIEWWDRLGIEVCQGYGMSENSAYCTACIPGQNKIGSVGKPVPGSEVKIDESGEILSRHPAVTPGYFKAPEKTAETIDEDGWLHTGDRGRFDEDGYLWITGRVKDIFKTDKGKYIAPAPIEGKLAKDENLEMLCMIGAGQKQPVMIATLSEAAHGKSDEEIAASVAKSMAEVNADLEPQERIAKVVLTKEPWTVEDGHLTATMKVRRHHIEELYNDNCPQYYRHDDDIIWV